MYIKNIFKKINENKSVKEHRAQLKAISSLNLRRNSKFNIMAIYGAIKILENIDYSDKLSIYIASEYGCMEDLLKVLEQINSKDEMLMPFDFLNVNTNNTGFLISQALNTQGNNVNISSEDLSFEKAFHLAYFDFNTKKINDILIGGVDESVEYIQNHNQVISNTQNSISHDGSSWFYLNNDKSKSIAKVKSFDFFSSIKELNTYLKTIQYDIIGLNQFATTFQDELEIDKSLIFESKNNFYGTQSAAHIIDILKERRGSSIYISLDSKKRIYLFHFES